MKIKICGLFRPEDILAVNKVLPDYIGFVFAKSRRQVTSLQAADLKKKLDPRIKAVGVFVNASVTEISELCRANTIDVVQLHGDEDNDYIDKLKQQVTQPVIKAVRVQSRQDILFADQLPVDFLLLDTYHQNSFGGTGERFDWSLIPPLTKPYFLAGGLNEENLTHAKATSAYCLDVSSGAETNGVKDKEKIARIVRAVKG